MSKVLLLMILYFSLLSNLVTYAQGNANKNTGIGFRVDDDHSIEMFSGYANVFRKYGYNFTFALNLSDSMMGTQTGIIDTIKNLIRDGNEMTDHTPNHSTKYFTVNDITPYIGKSGVDHIIPARKMICLQWDWVNTTTVTGEGHINISGNTVTSTQPGEFASMGILNTIYFNNTLYTYDPANVKTNSIQDTIKGLMNFWGEPVNLPAQNDIQYDKMTDYDIHMTPDALKLLVQASLDYCALHNIPRPHSWTQPGGPFPQLWKDDIAPVMGSLGYTSGATYPNPANMYFNDPNPLSLNQYAIQWGDFWEDYNYLPLVKNIIATRIALNRMSIGHSHFTSDVSWDDYLVRMDSLLAWCRLKNIPVYTYSEIANKLYNEPQNPYVNLVPRLDKDLNEDNNPDGYTIYSGTTIDTLDYPSGSIAKRSLVRTSDNDFFQINNLGSLEKGQNYFSFYAKGQPGAQIKVSMWLSIGESGVFRSFTFNLTTADWQKFELVNSAGDSTSLFIPEDAYSMILTIFCTWYPPQSSSIKIADVVLRKFAPEIITPPFLNKVIFKNKVNNIRWDINSTNHTYFKLQRRYEDESVFRTIETLSPAANTTIDSMHDFPESLSLSDTASVFYRVVAGNEVDSSTSNIDRVVVLTSSVLPVELTSFTASVENNKVVLTWNTATEARNYGFDIERKDSGVWKKIGFIKGSGNSNSPKQYSYYDDDLYSGNTLAYRLKQIDLDGKIEYSPEVEINLVPKVFALFQNYPNPFNPTTTIAYSISKPGIVSLRLYDILGREVALLINEYKEPGYYKYNFGLNGQTSRLSSGLYIYSLKSENEVLTKKMLLLK